MYCASNVGLGHLNRLTRVGRALRSRLTEVDTLLITDTQTLTAEEIDPTIGLVRLPGFEFREGSFKNRPKGLGVEKQELRDLRANLILAAATGFQPHVVLMDTNPHGKRNELEPLLKQLEKLPNPPLRVLQLRDIPFPPEESSRLQGDSKRVEADFDLYDTIFVAGDPDFFDLARNYGWPDTLASRLHYLGFVLPFTASRDVEKGLAGPERGGDSAAGSDVTVISKPIPVERWEAEGGAINPEEREQPSVKAVHGNRKHRHIVAAMGGGWELETFGQSVLDAYLHLYPEGGQGAHFTLFTGPAVTRREFEAFAAAVKGRPDIRIERYRGDFAADLRNCDLALLQAGSTPFQILESDIPMLIYSREYSTAEQRARAERLSAFPGIEEVWREDLEPARLAERMEVALNGPRTRRRTGFGFDGAAKAAELIAAGLGRGG